MAGINVHIPVCRSKCFYCGFYSVASLHLREPYVTALCREMELRKAYLSAQETIDTLYFGGGTPSCLPEEDIEIIIHNLTCHWKLSKQIECSIELNPEDATPDKLRGLRRLGFNRLTIGVQSFNDHVLKQINRTHTVARALAAIEQAAGCGFDNIGIDLIIGLPGYTTTDLEKDLCILNSLPLSHLSVYILSIDNNSVFEKLLQKGKFKPWEDDVLAEQYLLVSDYMKNIGFEHYEISNFAKNSKYSRHNTAYWQQKRYIGLGAAAHSYDLDSRQWNISNIKTYIDTLSKDQLYFEKEILTKRDKYNEYIMTGLRTMWGVSLEVLTTEYAEFWKDVVRKKDEWIDRGFMRETDRKLRLTERGWLISEDRFSGLFSLS